MNAFAPLLFCAVLLVAAAATGASVPAEDALLTRLGKAAPVINPKVLERALSATHCAVNSGLSSPQRLAIVDYSLPSTEKRLWIFDLTNGSLLLHDLVAHGRNSGVKSAREFSNREGSRQSSLGLFLGSESYSGAYGYSLRLDGLEPGINDKARDRAIVIHGADYAGRRWIEKHGRLGRSWGCPAVAPEISRTVVDNLKEGQLLFVYYPDKEWLKSSPFINCKPGDTGKPDKVIVHRPR